MSFMRKKRNHGFTIAELLIVVAIIAVLVAVAIPVFVSQLERSREAADIANVRSAYAEIMAAAITDDRTSALYQSDGTYKALVSLKQQQDGWKTSEGNLSIAGVKPSDENWVGSPLANGVCNVQYSPATDLLSIIWSNPGNAAYLAAVSPYKNQSLMNLKNLDNEERVAADQATLRALAEEILNQGWTKDELKSKLGILAQGNAVRIADYYQDKEGSYAAGGSYKAAGFRVDSKGEFSDILDAIGFDGGSSSTSSVSGKDYTMTTYSNSLFYSDELAANKFKSYDINATKRSIILEGIQTDPKSGVITGFTLYSKSMDDQANLNEAEKAKFRITVP